MNSISTLAVLLALSTSVLGEWPLRESIVGLNHGPLSQWWGCESSWNKQCSVQYVDLRLHSKLTECGVVNVDWSNAKIPEVNSLTYRVLASATWPLIATAEGSSADNNVSLPTQEFLTPATSMNWTVNYPAGATIEFQLDAYSSNVYYRGNTTSYTVGSGNTHCVPTAHKPVIVDYPNHINQCEDAMFSWSGGLEPVQAMVKAGHPGWYFVEQVPVKKLGSQSYIEFGGKFPAGAELDFYLTDADGNTLGTKHYLIQKGLKKCYINPDYKVHHWWRSRGALAGAIIGAIFGAIGLGLATFAGVYFGRKCYQKRKGAIALPPDVEEASGAEA